MSETRNEKDREDVTFEVRTAGHEYDEDGYTIGRGDTVMGAIADAADERSRFAPWLVEIRQHVTPDLGGLRICWPTETVVAHEHAGVWDLTEIYG